MGGLLRLRIGSVLAASAITAKVPASINNTDGPPKAATRTPATAGPITSERLKLNDQSIFAASRSLSSTSSGRKLRDPTSVAGANMPAKKVSRKSSQSSSKPNQYRMGIRPMMSVRMLLSIVIMIRGWKRSIKKPNARLVMMAGSCRVRRMPAVARPDPVTFKTNQGSAIRAKESPNSDTNRPTKRRPNAG